MDILITLNIKLYEERPKELIGSRERTPRIAHELYYWNIAVLAQITGQREVAELVGSYLSIQYHRRCISPMRFGRRQA